MLGPKALWAGEAYVQSLFHLYPAVYLHKTTRGAEKVFSCLLSAVKNAVDEGRLGDVGLPSHHPLVPYLKERSLDAYLRLDDAVMWGSLSLLEGGKDPHVRELAGRLRGRSLFKAVDVRAILADGRVNAGGEVAQRELKFRRILAEKMKADQSLVNRILIDQFTRDPYKSKSYDSPKAIERIHLLVDGHPRDLAEMSSSVEALKPFKIYRVYVAPEDDKAKGVVVETLEEARK